MVPCLRAPASASQASGGVTQVVCAGRACGGNGGSGNPCSESQYCYRVEPNGNPLTSFEVSVEDGDLSHYSSFCAPAGWDHVMVTVQGSHELCFTAHGQTTGKNSSCQNALRFFSSTSRTESFEVGFSYDLPMDGSHDVSWKSSDGQRSSWSFPVGSSNGPVHSPLPRRANVNILVVVLDDVACDKLTLFDQSHAHPHASTPRLNELSAGGIKFTSFYANPVCSPTRASLQTGRHPFRTGMSGNSEGYELPNSEVLLAELLTKGFPPGSGYRCGAFGKWHIGRIDPGHAIDNGYHRFYGTVSNVGLDGGDHFSWTKIEHDAGLPWSATTVTTWDADVVRADAVSWINAQNKPFFAYVGFNPPHVPWQVPPSQTQDGRKLLSKATIDALALSGAQPCDPDGALPGDEPEPSCADQADLFYRAALEAVDAEIGYLIDDMCAEQRENTMIFVLGDNGPTSPVIIPPHDPAHGKGTVYQHGVHEPLIVSGPLVPASGGHVCDRAVGVVDLWRTLAALTGADEDLAFQSLGFVQPYPEVDSVSFLPLIQDPRGPPAAPWAFAQMFGPIGPFSSVSSLIKHKRCMTDGRFKYIRMISDHAPGNLPDFSDYTHEFYDVLADPEETTNLWTPTLQDPVYLFLLSEMERLSEF